MGTGDHCHDTLILVLSAVALAFTLTGAGISKIEKCCFLDYIMYRYTLKDTL